MCPSLPGLPIVATCQRDCVPEPPWPAVANCSPEPPSCGMLCCLIAVPPAVLNTSPHTMRATLSPKSNNPTSGWGTAKAGVCFFGKANGAASVFAEVVLLVVFACFHASSVDVCVWAYRLAAGVFLSLPPTIANSLPCKMVAL